MYGYMLISIKSQIITGNLIFTDCFSFNDFLKFSKLNTRAYILTLCIFFFILKSSFIIANDHST